jgi:transposase
VAFLIDQAQQVEGQLDELTEQAAPALREVHGVGVHTAATLLVTVGRNPQRIRSDADDASEFGALHAGAVATSRRTPAPN